MIKSMHHPAMIALSCLLTCSLALPLAVAAVPPPPRPNILFIITDQQAADAMSFRMGRQYLHTPALDRLAKRGRYFARAYAANPLCMPSRNSMFTGLYPHQTRVTANDPPPGGSLNPAEFKCLGTYFREAGYHTAYYGKWHLCIDPANPAVHGFQTLETEEDDANTTKLATAFLSQKPTQPFLLVASFLNPHNACEWARRLAGRKQVLTQGEIGSPPPLNQLPPLPPNFEPQIGEPDGLTLLRRAYQVDDGLFPVAKFSRKDWRAFRWGYYRMIEKVDAQIGQVLAALRESGLEKNTLVVFTADHGECAGAHQWNQKTVLYEESARVPLIFSYPGVVKPGLGGQLVNTGIDLLPTMLDFAGIKVPEKLPGRSLKQVTDGNNDTAWRKDVIVESDMEQAGKISDSKPTMRARMVRTGDFKYCLYSRGEHRESLVNLKADPGEMMNLATDPSYRGVLLKCRALLMQFGQDHADPLTAEMLADNVKPLPFQTEATSGKKDQP